MIINQRVHMSQHQSRMIELQDQVIPLQERLLTANEGLSKARKKRKERNFFFRKETFTFRFINLQIS